MLALRVDRREPVSHRELGNLRTVGDEDAARQREHGVRAPFARGLECGLNILEIENVEILRRDAECRRGSFRQTP